MKKEHLDKQFYKMVLTIAIPVILQNLISIGLNMADTIMIGKLGVDELAAVGTANRLYFVFSSLCFGIYSGASVYVSQYWGVKDIKNICRTLGIDIILGGGMPSLQHRRCWGCSAPSRGSSSWEPSICTSLPFLTSLPRCPLLSTLTAVPSIC